MAIGLLGTGQTVGASPVTVYTVPSGISHAVVHITLCSSDSPRYARINGVPILISVNTSTIDTWNFATSMMLSPGDVVSVAGGANANCTVSGYEVPL